MGKITKTKNTLHQYFTKKSTSPGKDTNDTIVSNGKLLKYFIFFCGIINYIYYALI